MDQKLQLFLLLVLSQTLFVTAENTDFVGLKSLDWKNTPPNWKDSDPCGTKWDGIGCKKSRVSSITLSSMGLEGQLSGDIDQLSELETLDLSYNKELTGPLPQSIGNLKKLSNLILVGCGFSGQIPGTIGSLQELVFLSLNSNRFTGLIPPAIGNLSKLYWLDLADNNIEGPIPVSDGMALGLDMLHHCKHFHFGKNKLSGSIPEELFSSNMSLIHVLFDHNELSDSIPFTLGLVSTLEVVRLDGNSLDGNVPENLNNLTQVHELFLSNNKLTGPLPNLTGMDSLTYLDMSNNSFEESEFPSWVPTLQSLTTLVMEGTHLEGQIPAELFSLPNLETVVLKGNKLNGSLDIGISYSEHLRLIDLKSNLITEFGDNEVQNVQIILVDNPLCQETGKTESYCKISVSQYNNTSSYVTEKNNCIPTLCSSSDQISSPSCKCAYPYTGILYFRAPSFSDLGNKTYYKLLEESLMSFFQLHQFPVDSVSLRNPTKEPSNYLNIKLEVFPSGRDRFSRSEITEIGFAFSNQTYKPPKIFGPYAFIGEKYAGIEVPIESNKSSKLSTGVIIGAAGGGSALVLLLVLAGVCAFRRKRTTKRAADASNPFVRWDPKAASRGVGIPQLKGAQFFSFEEIKKCTKNFSEENDVGSGGYGKVYRGILPTGELIAVKRSQRESMQGGNEFRTEIELLSRVHHKNLVTLVGFCFDKGEQMLIYEYIPNGSLKDSLSGKSGISLDWMRRLRVALGTARGLAYLHELANPPIIHRDIKSTNVLLDDRLNAKVADFGLSKLMGDSEKDHVTTQVKGTMGYLDPEYYMTQQLTEKSDVYSFGVLMLELITARKPIEKGKYIVKEVRTTMDKTKELYNLHAFLDPAIGLGTKLTGFEMFVDLALRCVEDAGIDRPIMGEVVKEIEAIMKLAGLNPNADSASISASYEEANKDTRQHPYSEVSFDHSGVESQELAPSVPTTPSQ